MNFSHLYKTLAMPPTKIRGILREYLQILIMKEICRAEGGKKLYFPGDRKGLWRPVGILKGKWDNNKDRSGFDYTGA